MNEVVDGADSASEPNAIDEVKIEYEIRKKLGERAEPQPEPEPRWQSPPRERSVSRGSTDSASSTDSFFSAQGEVP